MLCGREQGRTSEVIDLRFRDDLHHCRVPALTFGRHVGRKLIRSRARGHMAIAAIA